MAAQEEERQKKVQYSNMESKKQNRQKKRKEGRRNKREADKGCHLKWSGCLKHMIW